MAGARSLLVLAVVVLAGCGGGGFTAPATPPPATFEVVAAGEDAVVLRYTGIGGQTTAKFRVVIEDGGGDGTYDLVTVTGDDRWTEDDRYVLNRSTLGLSAPFDATAAVVALQYDDDGDWVTLVRTQPFEATTA